MSKQQKSSPRGAKPARRALPAPNSQAVRDAAAWAVGNEAPPLFGELVNRLSNVEKVLMAHVEGRWSPGERNVRPVEMPVDPRQPPPHLPPPNLPTADEARSVLSELKGLIELAGELRAANSHLREQLWPVLRRVPPEPGTVSAVKDEPAGDTAFDLLQMLRARLFDARDITVDTIKRLAL